MKGLICIFLTVILLLSCKKSEDRSCWKSWGDDAEKRIDLPEFAKLYIREHIVVNLIQDTVSYVILRGGENMLNQIEVRVDDENTLNLLNNNKCSFIRGFKRKITAEIHCSELYNIHFEGSEPLNCLNTLNIDYLTFLIRDGAGEVNLKVKSKEIFGTISHGWGNFNIEGESDYLNLDVRSNGFCNTYGLQVRDSIRFISNTSANMRIGFADCSVYGSILSNGNVYYKGIPTSQNVIETGGGKLIQE